jgi:hypothetical protein
MTASDAIQLGRARWLLNTIKGLNREIMYASAKRAPNLAQLKSERERLGAEFADMPRWVREEVQVPSIEAARMLIESKCFDDEKAARLMRFVVQRSEQP